MSSHPFARFFPVRKMLALTLVTMVAIALLVLPASAGKLRGTGALTPRRIEHRQAVSRLRGPGVVFGAHVEPAPGQDLISAHQAFERRIGHKIGAARVYYNWDSAFPSSYAQWLKSTGRTIVMSIKSRLGNGTVVPWRSIANAAPGSPLYKQIASWATRIKAFGVRVYLIFNHEPEVARSDPMGNSTAFVAAWRKIVDVFRRYNVHNVAWTWTLTDWAFDAKDSMAANLWYPGNHYVDVIGADAYNFYRCQSWNLRPWYSLREKLLGVRSFAQAHHRPVILPEWGSTEDGIQRGRKARWIDQARSLFKQDGWHRFKMALYFDSRDSSHLGCNWPPVSSGLALQAFAKMAADSYYAKAG
jgi:Glycosyl hydrolase family 26